MNENLSPEAKSFSSPLGTVPEYIWSAEVEVTSAGILPSTWRFKYVTPSVQSMLGWTQEEFLAKNPSELVLEESFYKGLVLLNQNLDGTQFVSDGQMLGKPAAIEMWKKKRFHNQRHHNFFRYHPPL